VPTGLIHALEGLLGLTAAVVFTLLPGILAKTAALIAVTLGLIGLEWLTLHAFGVFFEAFIPVVGVWMHSATERFFAEK